jgi:monoamine oxidase
MPCSGKDDLEVVVVGAGAAGIGAAMRLAAARISFAIFEARGRVGGRAYTIADAPFPLDLGCGWLHSADRNPWTRIAAEAGFTIDRGRAFVDYPTSRAILRDLLSFRPSPESYAPMDASA